MLLATTKRAQPAFWATTLCLRKRSRPRWSLARSQLRYPGALFPTAANTRVEGGVVPAKKTMEFRAAAIACVAAVALAAAAMVVPATAQQLDEVCSNMRSQFACETYDCLNCTWCTGVCVDALPCPCGSITDESACDLQGCYWCSGMAPRARLRTVCAAISAIFFFFFFFFFFFYFSYFL